MALSRAERRRRNRLILGIGAVVVVFLGLQSRSLVQTVLAPVPPGYVKTPPPGQFEGLDWQSLQKAGWIPRQKPVVPEEVAALNGKPVTARGFQLPLHYAGKSAQFFLAAKPRGCYFCNPPGVSEVIEINVAGGKELSPSNWTVDVYGTFHVASGAPGDNVLYTIDNASVRVAF